MATDAAIYAARIRYTELLCRGETNTTELKIYKNGAQVIPTSATITIHKPDGLSIVENIPASIDGSGTLSYEIAASKLPASFVLGEGYLIEWSATIASNVYVFRRTAALTLRKLYPTVSDIDLTEEYANLDSLRPASMTSYETYILSAWTEILRRIRNTGMGYEYLILSPESLHDTLKHLALYKIFKDFHSSLGQSNGRFYDLSQLHYTHYKREYDAVNFVYDESHQGRTDEPDERTKGRPVIYLTAPAAYRHLRRK